MASRRQVLGTVAVALCGALAGCADPAGVLQLREATTDEIVRNATTDVRSGSDEAAVLDELVENGSATVEGTRPPLDDERPVAFRGDVLDVSATEVADGRRVEYAIELDLNPADTGGAGVALEELPAVDRERIEPLLEYERPPDDAGPDDGVDVGTREFYSAAERDRSVLVPEQEVEIVLVDGEPVRVRTEPRETTVTTYEYAIVDRLGTAEEYADELRETYTFALEGLSGGERAVVEEAIEEGGYYASSRSDDDFEGVARAFLDHEPVTSDEYSGEWIASYGGTAYWAMLDFPQYRDLRDELPSA